MGVDIESYCKRVFGDDEFVAECNWFVWRVANECCRKNVFGKEKDSVSADGMIELMRAGNGWREVAGADAGEVVDKAIEMATKGSLVVAGMTSEQLRDGHGHVAIVVAGAGEYSAKAQRVLPLGYAGSRNLAARIPSGARKHLGWTFPPARWKEIGYWYRSQAASRRARRSKRLST